MKRKLLIKAMVFALFVCIWSIPGIAGAHCDTLDGPGRNDREGRA